MDIMDKTETLENEYEGDLSPFSEVAHDFRLTFSGQDDKCTMLENPEYIKDCRRIARRFINKMYDARYFQSCIGSIEMIDKRGLNCRLHLHLRFNSRCLTSSLRTQIVRWLKAEDQETKGNTAMAFKAKVVRNEEEFFQYPLKQNLDYSLCKGYTQEKLDQMHEIAKASYLKVVEINQKKLDKLDNSDTIFERVLSKLQKLPNEQICRRVVGREFIQLYINENRPLNNTTIVGYTNTACVKLGITSIDELMDKWGI